VGDFCKDQGFQEIYGGGHMGDWASSNEWGVDDEHLFDFVKKNINDDQPSFNLILTTSFHPPFTVDVRAKGFTLNTIPPELREHCLDDIDFAIWGHLWYADKCIADFARQITARLPDALVVITADHEARRTISKKPDIFEKTSIPCVFYGPDVLKGIHPPSKMVGSHLDLTPTLVELAATVGFTYHTLGKDLLEPRSCPVGVGKGLVIGSSFFLDINANPRIH
jgi:phosphoglycerol transferase MdoB-like AlkP superfamily enzyme